MIDKLSFRNLTTMGECEIDLSSKMNVIIGANGMGKTHFLKAAYVLALAKRLVHKNVGQSKADLRNQVGEKLVRIFKPIDDKLGRLHSFGAEETTRLEGVFADGGTLTLEFSGRSSQLSLTHNQIRGSDCGSPIFIPTKEVLTFLDGITDKRADQQTIDRIFDDTYRDICEKLSTASDVLLEERIERDPRFGAIFPAIGNVIGGVFQQTESGIRFMPGSFGDRRVSDQPKLGVLHETVFTRSKQPELSGHMTAEGFRKIGMLQQLLANRSLDPGVSGTLFWDEPESNMNPRLMRLLVEILWLITRANQQIVLATHDYVLLKWIDLLADFKQGDHVRYHSLYRDAKSGAIRANSTDEYSLLSPNAIDDAFSDLTEEEISQSMGGLGK